MKRRKLIWHLYAYYLGISVISTFFIIWLIISQVRDFNIKNSQRQLEGWAKLVGSMLLERWPMTRKQIGDFCYKIAAVSSSRITVVDKKGLLLNDSEKRDRGVTDYSGRVEIVAALNGGVGRSERKSMTAQRKMVYVAVPIFRQGSVVAAVRVSYVAAAVYERESRSRWRLIAWMLFVFVVGAVASFATARFITQPLFRMEEKAVSIANGDYKARLKLPRSFEMAELARALNMMASKLEKRIDSIYQQRNQLGQKVKKHIEEKKILKAHAEVDALTGLFNRRKFDQRLAKEWGRAIKAPEPISLILCDVDFFKKFNDLYGHPEGDRCLAKVAAAIDGAVQRPDDFAARYGGEEFAVVLPNTPSRGAVQVAEAVREAVLGLKIAHAGSGVAEYVTVSLGVCTVVPNGDFSKNDLISCADKGLYEAKTAGRNCVRIK